jgi:hypothetical protein
MDYDWPCIAARLHQLPPCLVHELSGHGRCSSSARALKGDDQGEFRLGSHELTETPQEILPAKELLWRVDLEGRSSIWSRRDPETAGIRRYVFSSTF